MEINNISPLKLMPTLIVKNTLGRYQVVSVLCVLYAGWREQDLNPASSGLDRSLQQSSQATSQNLKHKTVL